MERRVCPTEEVRRSYNVDHDAFRMSSSIETPDWLSN